MTIFVPGAPKAPKVEQLGLTAKLELAVLGPTLPRPVNTRSPADYGLFARVFRLDATADRPALEGWIIPGLPGRGTVMLFHGYTASRDKLLPEAQALRDLGYSIVLADFPGSGGSGGDATTIGYFEADDVTRIAAFTERLVDGPFWGFGASMGAVALMRAEALHPLGLSGIVVEGPFNNLVDTVANRCDLMHVPRWFAYPLVFWGSVLHSFNGFALDAVTYAQAIHTPILVLSGGRDNRARPADVDAVYAALAGPKERRVFPTAAHESLLKNDPYAWRAAVPPFLEAGRPGAQPDHRSDPAR